MSKYTHEDGTPFTKEEFLEKLETDTEFNNEFGNKGIDQINELIKQLKENPDSRRLMVNAWAVDDLPKMVLPPCHYGFQVYTRVYELEERIKLAWQVLYSEKNTKPMPKWFTMNETIMDEKFVPRRSISLMWNQRSCDIPLGIPMNISSYALLLIMIAKQVNMFPEDLIGNLGDCHIYLNQIDGVKEQLTKTPYPLPTIKLSDKPIKDLSEYTLEDIILEDYRSHPTIKMPLSN